MQYKPNKDNISDVTVKIHGLSSDSFFLFRIYSVNELNQQEQDRNKWKYAKVFVKTKTKGKFINTFYVIQLLPSLLSTPFPPTPSTNPGLLDLNSRRKFT